MNTTDAFKMEFLDDGGVQITLPIEHYPGEATKTNTIDALRVAMSELGMGLLTSRKGLGELHEDDQFHPLQPGSKLIVTLAPPVPPPKLPEAIYSD